VKVYTGLTVNSRMTIETEMSLNADGNTAVTAFYDSSWQTVPFA